MGDYDEFGMLHENAEEVGLTFEPPTVARVGVDVPSGLQLSALVWGDAPAELVLLHLQPNLESVIAFADRIQVALQAQGWAVVEDSSIQRSRYAAR